MVRSLSDLAESAYKLAFKYEKEYGGCAQSTLAGIFDTLKIRENNVFKSATGLAGGIGLSGDGTCGALIGAAMAISYLFGRERKNFADPQKRRFMTYKLVKQLYNAFLNEFGSCRCFDIQKRLMGRTFNLFDPNEYTAFLKAGGHEDKCTRVCGTAAKLAVNIILSVLKKKGRKNDIMSED